MEVQEALDEEEASQLVDEQLDRSCCFVDFDDVSRDAVDPSYYFVDCQLANQLAPNLRLAD